jgi:hypothetical protein
MVHLKTLPKPLPAKATQNIQDSSNLTQMWTHVCVLQVLEHYCSINLLSAKYKGAILIVVFPCMLTIIQLLFQQNAHVFYY